MIPSPVHLNKDIYASVYVETTGPYVGFHDIYRMCILPLDNFMKPAKGVVPFLITFKPIYEDHPWISKDDYAQYSSVGVHPGVAGSVLSLWAQRLPKQYDKRLCPIAYNWPFMSAFMKSLFGSDVFDQVFHETGRDISSLAASINDCCDLSVQQIPFPKTGFISICNRLNLELEKPHDSLNLCRATPVAYSLMLKRLLKNFTF